MPTYGWGANEPDISPVAEGGDTIATYATKVKAAISDLFDTLNTFPWANATQSSAGFMSSDDKKAVDGIEYLGTFNKMFFSQTSGSYVAPRTGVYRITLKGGGGGGGGAQTNVYATGGGGGEGGTLQFYTTLIKSQSYPYVIGAGGAAGQNGNSNSTPKNGTTGGTTSFNSTYSVAGGYGGQRPYSNGYGGGGGTNHTPADSTVYFYPGLAGGDGSNGYTISTYNATFPSGGGRSDNNLTYNVYGKGGNGGGPIPNDFSTVIEPTAGTDGYILIEYAG